MLVFKERTLTNRSNERGEVLQQQPADHLQEREEYLLQLLENSTSALWINDIKSGKLLYVNPAYEQMWGQSRRSLYDNPRSYLDAVHPEDRQVIRFRHEKFDQEYRIIRPDGSIRWILSRGFPIHDQKGEAYRMAGILTDITDRKEMEREIQRHNTDLAIERQSYEQQITEQKDLLWRTIDSLPHPLCVLDAEDFTVALANSATYDGELPQGVTCHQLTHGTDQPCNTAEQRLHRLGERQ